MQLHKRDWVFRFPKAVWAFRTTWKTIKGFTPYDLVYGKIVVLPIEFEYKTLCTIVDLGMDLIESQKERLQHLNALDEIRLQALCHTKVIQKRRIKWHEQYIKTKEFTVGDWVLLYDSRYKDFHLSHRLKLYKKPLEHNDFIISLMDEYGVQSSANSRSRTQDDVPPRSNLSNTFVNTEVELHNSTSEIT